MIKKIDIPQSTAIDASVLWGGINDNVLAAKINEVIDTVNFLDEEYNNQLYALSMDLKNKEERIEKLEKLVSTLVEENNTHEKQIDELQMKLEPEKCEIRAENVQKETFVSIDEALGKMKK